jgi:hypothetical protein
MAKSLKTSPIDRKCRYPGCPHILSIYNHESYCHVHLERKQSTLNPKHTTLVPATPEVVTAETL